MADTGVYFGDEEFVEDVAVSSHFPRTLFEAKQQFKKFVKEYRQGSSFPYRARLQDNWQKNDYSLEVFIQHIEAECESLAFALREKPLRYLPPCEAALQEVWLELTEIGEPVDNATIDENGLRAGKPKFQLILRSDENPRLIRNLQSEHVEKLVCVAGIIIQAAVVEHKTFALRLRCKACGNPKDISLRGSGRSKGAMPRKCDKDNGGDVKCGLDPYVIIGEECVYDDVQSLKLQELPEDVPTGEMPRSVQVVACKALADRLTAGMRVSMMGVFTAEERVSAKDSGGDNAVKYSYLQLLGFVPHADLGGRGSLKVSAAEEERFLQIARSGKAHEMIFKSVAPAIMGSKKDCIDDVKKAIACLLFGGSRKMLPDGTRLRGDINVLLLGDPGTAKSQFLKYVERAAPIAVYTSGKGSSAAGLTAAVVRDQGGRFALEGGAMVLADGGCVCIDEFDKMRPDDRVAIHEAMEQQTISIAKAGITTVLNTRCAVLAAANPIFGTWSSLAETAEQMDFATTILSRFDLIFLVRDVRDEDRDMQIATHVIALHASAAGGQQQQQGADPDVPFSVADLRKYINFCRSHCDPRLTERASSMLQNHYVTIRKRMLQERRTGKGSTVPITVRQLEALARISESLARMELSPEATESHVEEAIRLFTLSTLDAANKNATGVALSEDDRKKVFEVEDGIRRRIHIGGRKSKAVLTRDLESDFQQGHIQHAIRTLLLRGELEETTDHCYKRLK